VIVIGILGALVLRAVAIAGGLAVIETVEAVVYVFGVLLVYVAYRALWTSCKSVRKEKPRYEGFAEPSNGLEPLTPSLPFAPSGNPSQPRQRFGLFRRFRARSTCHRLPSAAPAWLHKCSMPGHNLACCQIRRFGAPTARMTHYLVWRARRQPRLLRPPGAISGARGRCCRLGRRPEVQPLVGQEAMDELHRDRALSDGGGHAFD
jgi:integral membrane protein TerC family protein